MRRNVLQILILFFFFQARAQTNQVYPVQFQQFFNTYNLINPASIGTESNLELKTGDKVLTGIFKGVRVYYLNVNYRLNQNKKSDGVMKHVLGGIFYNDKEGSYFSRNRGSLAYSVHIPLKDEIRINAGASLGFINYAYQASNLGGGGSAFALNSDAGLWMYGSDFNVGFSLNQIFPGKLIPLEQVLALKRHFNLNAEKKFLINPGFSVKPAFQFRYINKQIYDIDFAMLGILQNVLSVGVNYKYQKGVAFMGGVENVKLGNSELRLMFSYFTYFSNTTVFVPQSLEISMNLFFGK